LHSATNANSRTAAPPLAHHPHPATPTIIVHIAIVL
jgi:hypothetical protein